MSNASKLPVYRVNLKKPFPQKSMVKVTDLDSMYYVRSYPNEHFFDLAEAWKALEDLFRKELQAQSARYYDTKALVSRMEGELSLLEFNLAAIARREGAA